MAKKKFVCSICGHVHEGNSAPDTCPVCQASSSAFTEDRSGQKKGWMHNPNSNTYIIVYSTVMVVIVATLLAVASLSLQKRQAENELQEKKSNILQSLGYSPDENPQEFDRALADFDNQVKSFVLDADGVKTETPSKEGTILVLVFTRCRATSSSVPNHLLIGAGGGLHRCRTFSGCKDREKQ